MFSRPNTIPPDSRVISPIDIHTREWRKELVRKVFHPTNAYSILTIPLSNHLPPDRVVSTYTPKGKFMVCSAYKLALAKFVNTIGETSNNSNHKTFWQTVWGLNFLNKIKTFAWRLCRNILRTKANLRHCQVISIVVCEACGSCDETSRHLFWECKIARDAWLQFGIIFDMQGVRYCEFLDLF